MSKLSPWGPSYGLARSLLAVGTILTLSGNSVDLLFRAAGGMFELPPNFLSVERWTLFWLLRDHLEFARWLAIAILAVAASGYRPRVTGILHWWVTLSFISASCIPDGGDQATTVLTLLLLPITLTDPRKWHWSAPKASTQNLVDVLASRLARSAFFVVRLQVCAIYLNACMAKSRVAEWVNGTALYYWINDPLMGAGREYVDTFTTLLSNPYLVCALTWSVLLMQISLSMGLLMSTRTRPILLPIGLVFHVANIFLFGLMSFCFAMAAALILYLVLPESDIRDVMRSNLSTLRRFLRARYSVAEETPSPT